MGRALKAEESAGTYVDLTFAHDASSEIRRGYTYSYGSVEAYVLNRRNDRGSLHLQNMMRSGHLPPCQVRFAPNKATEPGEKPAFTILVEPREIACKVVRALSSGSNNGAVKVPSRNLPQPKHAVHQQSQ
jgi:hypothetical protein